MKRSGSFIIALLVSSAAAAFSAPASAGGALSLAAFNRQTGMNADAGQIQQTWSALQAMGTTKFLGGMLGGLKLDESSMLAGAMSIGASEFDNLLNGGGLGSSSSGTGQELLGRMTSASGLDLSYLTGSFTSGGGGTTSISSLLTGGGASSGSGECDPSVASALASGGKKHVDNIVTAASSQQYGFSKVGDLTGTSGTGSGFAALGCLDKLFQNAGSDIMFKPPSLGSLTTQLQNWVCGQAESVQDQVAGAFGSGEIFQTAGIGGFFPSKTFGEANDGAPNNRPGLGQSSDLTFGSSFADFGTSDDNKIAQASDLQRLMK